MATKQRIYASGSKRGVRSISTERPARRPQDKRFKPAKMFAVVFFPRLKHLGPAQVWKHTIAETLSYSREAAIGKFMDRDYRTGSPETWAQYRRAGWKVRRVMISDLGP